MIPDILTQQSSKEAGDWTITSYLKVKDDWSIVDTVTVAKSFIVLPGKVDAAASDPITVTDPVCYGKDSVYTLNFEINHFIPLGGDIKIQIPKEI
jgi:hypothetical protein